MTTNTNNLQLSQLISSRNQRDHVEWHSLLNCGALTPLQVENLYNGGQAVRFGPSTGSP